MNTSCHTAVLYKLTCNYNHDGDDDNIKNGQQT